jgi:23S rRNA pseudouridine2605 synthase
LQKVLAAAGIGSRRDCEELIRQGRVEVDRQTITELGTRVDPVRQEIRVDGEPLRRPKRMYYAVNKPTGVVTTNFDPSGRPRVIDLVPSEERLFAVGRLDRASEGLIFVTNDGEFANRITHPRYGVEKTYLVRVAGEPTPAELAKLVKGVYLAEGFARVQSVVAKKRHGQSTDLVMVLNEGRNRELRRILARVGHKVLRLKRIAVGPVKLADLPTGAWRRLMPAEIETLLNLAKERRKAAKAKRKRREGDASKQPAETPAETPYLQQQALMAEPLSLDDLLRDDLDEGNLAEADDSAAGNAPAGAVGNALRGIPEAAEDLTFSDDAPPIGRPGAIIGDDAAGPNRPKPKHRGKRPFRKPAGDNRQNERLESLPRESYGKKRGGKRQFGRPNQGRGPAGKAAGNFEFRPKAKRGKKRFEQKGQPGGKQFGRRGDKRKGRR